MGKQLKSILTDDMDHCMFTGSPIVERHHVFGGSRKKNSEKYGFMAPLFPELHPNGVFFKATEENKKIDLILKTRCQKWYEENIGTREEFIQEFGKSYL